MLVVTSNWCVSDGTLSAGPPRGLVERFRAEVRRSSLRCGFRRDGSYQPIDAVDVVLAGDTFDWLVSREWTGDVRPWDGGRRAAAALQRVATGSLRQGSRLLAMLAAWMRRGIEVPVADRRGRPQPAVSRPVPVRVAVLCGDRDRWLEHVMSGSPPVAPGPVIGTTWSDGDATVRHGAELDPLTVASGSEPTLGDSLAVDLIGRFGVSLHDIAMLRPLATGLLRRLAGGCPIESPRRLTGWLDAHDRGATLSGATRQEVADAWRRAVAHWHRTARRLPCCGAGGVDLVGRVAELLELQPATAAPQRVPWFDAVLPMEVGGSATLVLGHPPADIGSSAAWQRQVVCLGPRSCHARDGLNDDSGIPAAVVVTSPGRADQRIDWIQMTTMKPFGHPEDGRAERGVWLSSETDDPRALRHIVDAA
jgi:hypothetical protein